MWAIFSHARHTFVGLQGLTLLKKSAGCAEIGFMLTPSANGKGYAVEGMGALVEHAFCQLGLHEIIACFQSDHLATERFVRKLGFNPLDGSPAGIKQYSIARSELMLKNGGKLSEQTVNKSA